MKKTSSKSLSVAPKILKAFERARATRLNAHAPYSGFQVGAALVTSGGEIITGCNVENASYGGTVCAERIAIFKAVSEEEKAFTDIVVVTDAAEPAFPCAFCLQIMAEFFDPSTQIYLADTDKIKSVHSFESLLPHPFGPVQLKTAKATAKNAAKSPVKNKTAQSKTKS